MKKIITYILAFLFSFGLGFAQVALEAQRAKSFISISGGYSVLRGQITRSDYYNTNSGYANRSGYNVGLDGAYYLTKHLGLGGVFSFESFSAAHLQSLSNGYQNDFDVDSVSVTATTKYNFYTFFMGPYFSFPVQKFTLDARVTGGIALVNTPEFDVNVVDGGKPHPFAQNISYGSAFGFQTGIGIRYAISHHIALKLNADYYYTDPNIPIKNSNRPIVAGRILTDYHQPITMLKINLGTVYQF